MNLRLISTLVAVVALLAGLAYLNARLDRANEADALETELTGMKAQVAANEQKAKTLETELQAVRLQAGDINRKWSKLRASQNRTVCHLDPDTRGLLKSAAADDAR